MPWARNRPKTPLACVVGGVLRQHPVGNGDWIVSIAADFFVRRLRPVVADESG